MKGAALRAAITLTVALPVTASAQTMPAPPAGIVADPCAPDAVAAWADRKHQGYYGNTCRYRDANRALIASRTPVRIVLMGDSITDFWRNGDPALFTDGVVDRGISGQTSSQMLVRFRDDVIALHPKAVQIMAGINDIAGNTGPTTIDAIMGNIESMTDLSRAHGIRVLIASVLPAADFPWAPGKDPAPKVVDLNRRLRIFAAARGLTYVDYYPALANPAGGIDPMLAKDGVHPTAQGYAAMRPIADAAFATVK